MYINFKNYNNITSDTSSNVSVEWISTHSKPFISQILILEKSTPKSSEFFSPK